MVQEKVELVEETKTCRILEDKSQIVGTIAVEGFTYPISRAEKEQNIMLRIMLENQPDEYHYSL